jgi:wobble nucleotide-excising tRNase
LDGNPLPDKAAMDRSYEVFSKNPQPYSSLKAIDAKDYSDMDSAKILSKRIVGSGESTIGTFFKSLQNSDWAHCGMEYLPHSNGKCPFCMGTLSKEIIEDLKRCFDTEYETDLKALNEYADYYNSNVDYILSLCYEVVRASSPFVLETNTEKLFDELEKTLRANYSKIAGKLNTPSENITISPVSDKIEEVAKTINTLNEKISEHNKSIADKKKTGESFKENLKKTFAKEIESEIGAFVADRKSHEKQIGELNKKREGRDERKKNLDSEIETLEEQISNIHEVVERINKILKTFGFTGFKLQEDPNNNKWYQIVRSNGDSAHETLSEGERNFIAFLYFCHMIKGSQERSGTTNQKIVLIDDPITSMDGNVIFIVSSLTKDLINDEKNVGQFFLFTHNIYFFKEVSPFGNEFEQYPKYFVVEKKDDVTDVTYYRNNPIKSSYELVWEEYKSNNPITVFNAMRRILEQYLGNFCGTNLKKMPDKFEGEDKIICKALVASLHDGSHSIPDDIMYCSEKISVESNKKVFREIFVINNHLSHYNKMTGSS